MSDGGCRWWCFGDMNREYSGFAGTSFSFCYILGPFTKGGEGNVVKFAVLLTGKTTGPPTGDMLFFLFNEPSLSHP
ncbi:hypothetical protein GVv1_47710 (plasmid) [Enterobacter pseudoroggenkampii]